ncbi:amidase [Trichoderma evansii]
MALDWEKKAEAKRQAILDSIPQKWRLDRIPSAEEQKDVTDGYIRQFLNSKESKITETDIGGIAKQIAAGSWTSVEVAEAFCHRAAIAHQLVNCVHEFFFDAAIESAKALDAYFAKHKKPIGLLHGVPISLKDQFHVKGVETTMGYVGWMDTFEGNKDDSRRGTFESEMVRELRNLGAVLYCKTSCPQTLMSGETFNNIIEYTWNPKNRFLCSGGSSGGEGALIRLKGSPGGFGTDIAGSIRMPAAFSGTYGIKPTWDRLPYRGIATSMDGQNSILSSVGPMATTAAGAKLLVQAILSQQPWLHDPLVVDMPWRDTLEAETKELTKVTSKGPLVFGVLKTDGVVNPQPPVARAISVLTAALTKAGHKVVEWTPPANSHQALMGAIVNSWRYDGGKNVHDAFALSGERMHPQILRVFGTSPGEQFNATQIAENNIERRRLQTEYLDYWNSTIEITGTGRPVDGFICPVAPYAAARPQKYKYYGYSAFVNILNYTSVNVPVTLADKDIDKYDPGYVPLNELDSATVEDYDAELYDGAHVGLQIVGRSYTEEKMLVIAEYVSELLSQDHA